MSQFIDRFIPSKTGKGSDQLRRARVSVWVNFCGIGYGFISLIIFYFADFSAGIISAWIILAGLITSLFLFRHGFNKSIIGTIVSVSLISCFSVFSFYTGGISSPVIILYAMVPMVALIVYRQNGLLWTIIVSSIILVFYFLRLMGYHVNELTNRSVANYIYVSTSIGFFFFVYLTIRLSLVSEKKALKELAKKNEQLDQSYKELKSTQALLVQAEKMSSLGQLTAGVAHEINNPINFVSANITPLKRDINDVMALLEKYSELDAENFKEKFEEINRYRKEMDLSYTIKEMKSLLSGIEEGSKRTAEIVRGLRQFSRLDEKEMKKVNINEGIESTLVLLRGRLDQKKIEVKKSLTEDSEIECHPGQINQVFMNLITNAIDAIGENGTIEINTKKENGKMRISIHDSGHGMSEVVKHKIFDPFFTTKEVGKGTGLGLSISYGIIKRHKGHIDVNSEEGKGTEFVVWLPVQ